MDRGEMRDNTLPPPSSRCWTNERHMQYLNSMEASFVQSMFNNNNGHNNPHLPPLDRYMPDSSESTQDLRRERRSSLSDINTHQGNNTGSSAADNINRMRRRRSLSSRPQTTNSSQDQVVPRFDKCTT